MSGSPFRLLLSGILLTLASAAGGASAPTHPPLPLTLDRTWAAPRPPVAPLVAATPALGLSQSRSLEASATPPRAAPAPVPGRTDLAASAARSAGWLVAALLALQLVACWLRVLRRKIQRPESTTPDMHADWPPVTLLALPGHCAAEQARRLRGLAKRPADYPANKLHYLVPLNPADAASIANVLKLEHAFPGQVHVFEPGDMFKADLCQLIRAALPECRGEALLLHDPLAHTGPGWIKAAISPMLDPASRIVVRRITETAHPDALYARLAQLTERADARLSVQEDALALLLAGKARLRALALPVLRALPARELHRATESDLALSFCRRGWHTGLADGAETATGAAAVQPHGRLLVPRLLRALVCLRISTLLRRQILTALRQRLISLCWLLAASLALILYLLGERVQAGLLISLCVTAGFDLQGRALPAYRVAAALRSPRVRQDLPLLPLAVLGHLRHIAAALPGGKVQAAPAPTLSHPSLADETRLGTA